MTEEEAKKLQCCGPQAARQFNPVPMCVGSLCMAWTGTDCAYVEEQKRHSIAMRTWPFAKVSPAYDVPNP